MHMIYVHLLNQEFPSKWPPPLKLDKFKGDGSQYPFVEEYQTYKQLQYPQFNSRIPQNRNIGQRNYQTQSRNTYLPRPQNNYRKNRDRRQEGARIEPSICMFCNIERHPRNLCPAKDHTCHNCKKKLPLFKGLSQWQKTTIGER